MTARCSEIAQVRCDCLAQVDVAAIRRITQQVNAFFCQNLSSGTFPCSYWKFIDGGNARHQRDAWSRARRPEVELISNACIRNCFYAFRDASWTLNWLGGFSLGPGLKALRNKIRDGPARP